jgi:hypothetical protein
MSFVYNWTTKDFTYPWARDLYTLKAGTVYHDVLTADNGQTKLLIVPGIAQHFAKHLANRQMSDNELLMPKEERKVAWNLAQWEGFYKKGLELPPAAPVAAPVVAHVEMVEIPEEPVAKKRMGRPPKASKIPPVPEMTTV